MLGGSWVVVRGLIISVTIVITHIQGLITPLIILVAEWIHFTLFGIILPTIKLKVYTFGGL